MTKTTGATKKIPWMGMQGEELWRVMKRVTEWVQVSTGWSKRDAEGLIATLLFFLAIFVFTALFLGLKTWLGQVWAWIVMTILSAGFLAALRWYD